MLMTQKKDGDYDYSDWKAGDWCWLLPADNRKNRQKQPEGDGAIDVTTETDITSTTTTGSSSGTKRSTRQLRYIDNVIKDANAAAGPDEDPPPKKKMRLKEISTDENDDRKNIKTAAINHETDNNVDIGIGIKEKVEVLRYHHARSVTTT
jgi:hypothetical protein